MSADLRAVPTDPEDEWLRRLAELTDGELWTLSETLVEHYPLDEYPSEHGRNTGLDAALRRDELELARQFGIIATAGHLAACRLTAIAWPDSARAPSASFAVHLRMRGEDRQAEMAKRLRQAKREGMALSVRMLARLRADENPKPTRQYEERMRRAIASAVKREMLAGYGGIKRDDWWALEQIIPSMTAEAAAANRDVAVRELRALASKIAKGPIEASS